MKTKRKVYQACVLSTLLYGAECWTPCRKDLKRLDSFHHRCIRNTLGISNQQQWDQHITSQSIRQQWGDTETVKSVVDSACFSMLVCIELVSVSRDMNQFTPKLTQMMKVQF